MVLLKIKDDLVMVTVQEKNGMTSYVYHGYNYGYVLKNGALYMYCLGCKKTDKQLQLIVPPKTSDYRKICDEHRKSYDMLLSKLKCRHCKEELR